MVEFSRYADNPGAYTYRDNSGLVGRNCVCPTRNIDRILLSSPMQPADTKPTAGETFPSGRIRTLRKAFGKTAKEKMPLELNASN